MFMFLGIYHLRPGTSSFRRTSSLAQCCSVSPFALANDGTGRIDCTNTCAVGCALQRRPSVVQELAQTESAFLWNAGQRKEETKYTISFEFMCGTAQEVSPSVRPTFFFSSAVGSCRGVLIIRGLLLSRRSSFVLFANNY